MQGLEKSYQRRGLRRAQIFPVRRHVSATLNYLADELVLREPHSYAVQIRASQPATLVKSVAIAALFGLKNQRALPLKGGRAMQKLLRHGIAAPGVHVRTPGCELREMGEGPERDRNQQHGQDRNRPTPPALFAFSREKGKKEQPDDHHDRADQKCWSLKRRGEQREQGIEPQEKVVWLRRGLDNRRVRLAGRSKWAEVNRANGDCQEHKRREEQIFPNGIGEEGRAVFFCQ